jgi:hypothetical protein
MTADRVPDLPVCLSLGAGVQSSALALAASQGVFTPMPKCAVFADTQDEPASVYRWLNWLEKQLAFPVFRVTAGRLSDRVLDMRTTADGRVFAKVNMPFFTLNKDGSFGMVQHRGCTRDFKLTPIRKFLRRHFNVKRGTKYPVICSWIGISVDEFARAKPSRYPWVVNQWPLMDARWTRTKCNLWFKEQGYPEPPRSACVYCPYHCDSEWRRLKNEEPEEFQRAVEFERFVQEAKKNRDNVDSVPYLHRSRKPLDEVDFRNDLDRGQLLLWQDECEGMCGV